MPDRPGIRTTAWLLVALLVLAPLADAAPSPVVVVVREGAGIPVAVDVLVSCTWPAPCQALKVELPPGWTRARVLQDQSTSETRALTLQLRGSCASPGRVTAVAGAWGGSVLVEPPGSCARLPWVQR